MKKQNRIKTLYKKLEKGNKKVAFVSGNTPLLSVLKKYLKEETGVSPWYMEGIYSYLPKSFKDPEKYPKNIIAYDEAQRAWDASKMETKLDPDYRHNRLNYNENDEIYMLESRLTKNSEAFATLDLCNEYFKSEGKIDLLVILGPG